MSVSNTLELQKLRKLVFYKRRQVYFSIVNPWQTHTTAFKKTQTRNRHRQWHFKNMQTRNRHRQCHFEKAQTRYRRRQRHLKKNADTPQTQTILIHKIADMRQTQTDGRQACLFNSDRFLIFYPTYAHYQ